MGGGYGRGGHTPRARRMGGKDARRERGEEGGGEGGASIDGPKIIPALGMMEGKQSWEASRLARARQAISRTVLKNIKNQKMSKCKKGE